MKSNCKITYIRIGKLIITHAITLSKILSPLNKSAIGLSHNYTPSYDVLISLLKLIIR
jgi:hypothetical protein